MLLWKKEINIQQLFSAPNYIDVQIQERPDKIWRLTGVYGEPRCEDKYKTWDRIRELHSQHNLPWVLIGDFNEILFSHEKEGGNPRPLNFMQNFRDVLTDCNLHDIGFLGDQFTWRRGRIRERLGTICTRRQCCTIWRLCGQITDLYCWRRKSQLSLAEVIQKSSRPNG
jgi:hypothetical protein